MAASCIQLKPGVVLQLQAGVIATESHPVHDAQAVRLTWVQDQAGEPLGMGQQAVHLPRSQLERRAARQIQHH